MSWLNIPEAIIEDYRVIEETQETWYTNEAEELIHESRTRLLTWTTTRWVGCDYDGAKAKADALAADKSYTDIHLAVAGGGQYHCIATQEAAGAWGEWADD